MSKEWLESVKSLRTRLKLTQQNFGALIGISSRAVSEWEQGRAEPDRLSLLMLQLVAIALGAHPRDALIAALRRAGPEPLPLVRALVWLEHYPSSPQGPSGGSPLPSV